MLIPSSSAASALVLQASTKVKTRSALARAVGMPKGLSTKEQQYDPTSIINEIRAHVDAWRSLPNSNQWQVTPETARLDKRTAGALHSQVWRSDKTYESFDDWLKSATKDWQKRWRKVTQPFGHVPHRDTYLTPTRQFILEPLASLKYGPLPCPL
jgi:hypothetical protein